MTASEIIPHDCGGEGRIERCHGLCFVRCEQCGAIGRFMDTQAEAVAAWNLNRSPEDISKGKRQMRNYERVIINEVEEADWQGPGYYVARQHQTLASGQWVRWEYVAPFGGTEPQEGYAAREIGDLR